MTHEVEVMMEDWMAKVNAGWGSGPHVMTLEAIGPRLAEVVDRRVDAADGLAEVGRRCGADGHPLEDVVGWVTTLFEMLPSRRRRHLDRHAGAVALASGWSEGMLQRHAAGMSPVTTELLRIRLQEHYDACAATSQDPVSAYTLVVFDADTGVLGPRARAAAMAALLEAVRARFTAGETITTTRTGRVLMLADRSRELPAAIHELVTWAQTQAALSGCRVRGWIEPLSPFRHHLDGHLNDLSR
jgi:hypothetical protein